MSAAAKCDCADRLRQQARAARARLARNSKRPLRDPEVRRSMELYAALLDGIADSLAAASPTEGGSQ